MQEKENRSKIILASGYFDPLHAGHVEYLEKASKLGDKLIVIVNNDEQAIKKKDLYFTPLNERLKVVGALRFVNEAIPSIDKDSSVKLSIAHCHKKFGKISVFAKGGDRYASEIPEAQICRELGIRIVDGLGSKIQSSSEMVKRMLEKFQEKNKISA